MHSHNKLYKNTTLGCLTIFIINFVISNYILYNDEVFWTIGLAPYASYMILVLMKIYNCYYIATHSIANDKALSAYMTEFSSFNVIDPDMLALEDKQEGKEEKNEVLEPLPGMIPNPLPNVVV